MKLNELYESILKFAGARVDDKGFVYTLTDDKKEPFYVDRKRLALPFLENLKNFQPNEMIIFHPLSENVALGESEIIQKLRTVINIRLNFILGILIRNLLQIASDPEYQKGLTPEQADLLIDLKDVDEAALVHFVSVMNAGNKKFPDSCFVNIYLKRGGRVQSVKYSRAGIVNFKFLTEIDEEKNTIFGVKVRQKDKQIYKAALKYIFPEIEKPQAYDYGSDNHTAPFLDALMKTALNIASRLNDIIALFEDRMACINELMFDADWVESFNNLDSLLPEIRMIPMQHGNEGTSMLNIPAQVGDQLQTPVLPQLPGAPSPAQMQPNASYPYAQPAYPTQPAAQPASSGLVRTERGLDFQSLNTQMGMQNRALNPFYNQAMANQPPPMMLPPGYTYPVQQPQPSLYSPQPMVNPAMMPQPMQPGYNPAQPTPMPYGWQPAVQMPVQYVNPTMPMQTAYPANPTYRNPTQPMYPQNVPNVLMQPAVR